MMVRNLYDYFWTATTIAKALKAEDVDNKIKNVDNKAENIRNDFKEYFMNSLGFSEKEIAWFRTDILNERGGEYIFGDILKKDIPNIMENVLETLKSNLLMTTEEKDNFREQIKKLLPMFRRKEVFGEENIDIKELIAKYNVTEEKCDRIDALVEEYYIKTRTVEFFDQRLFVKINGNTLKSKDTRTELYFIQYKQIREWAVKWLFVMQYVEAVRMAERCECGYAVCMKNKILSEDRKLFYRTGKTNNGNLAEFCENTTWMREDDLCESVLEIYKESKAAGEMFEKQQELLRLKKAEIKEVDEVKTKEKCRKKCKLLVEQVVENSLKETSEKDYKYICCRAFVELESISYAVKGAEKDKIINNYYIELNQKDTEKAREDFKKLYNVRVRVESRRKQVTEVKEYTPTRKFERRG